MNRNDTPKVRYIVKVGDKIVGRLSSKRSAEQRADYYRGAQSAEPVTITEEVRS